MAHSSFTCNGCRRWRGGQIGSGNCCRCLPAYSGGAQFSLMQTSRRSWRGHLNEVLGISSHPRGRTTNWPLCSAPMLRPRSSEPNTSLPGTAATDCAVLMRNFSGRMDRDRHSHGSRLMSCSKTAMSFWNAHFRRTVKKLHESAGFQGIVQRLRSEGWRDWHILLAILNVKISELNRTKLRWPIADQNIEDIVRQARQPEDDNAKLVPVHRFTYRALQQSRRTALLSLVNLWESRDAPINSRLSCD